MTRFNGALKRITGLFGKRTGQRVPAVTTHRCNANHAAIVFVHGFQGHAVATWQGFVTHIEQDPRLADWDIYSAGYPTSLTVDLPIWTADPQLRLCAGGLSTKLRLDPLDRYDAVAIIAHSMGGLVAQRAILDDLALRRRLSHLVLFGSPSNGLTKALLGKLLKPQVRDMMTGSEFITRLRSDWNERVGEKPHFTVKAVAGETDAFVPPESSIFPFPVEQQEVVPGNHLEIVRPTGIDHPSYQLLFKTLTGETGARGRVESARLAVERRDFAHAVHLLLPHAAELDANAVVTLSLALESLGRSQEALKVIEECHTGGKSSLDAIGVLAGRLKRRWLVQRRRYDLDRAFELYRMGLSLAEERTDHAQAYYHAINVAFLELMSGASDGPVSDEVCAMASRALEHAGIAHETAWSLATIGEARLLLGDLEGAANAYRVACNKAKTLRDRDSMYMQAIVVAERTMGEKGIEAIEEVFGLKNTNSVF